MRRFLFTTVALVLITGATAAHAQFGSGIVFDPTQSGHAIQQIAQGQQIFTNTVKLANNAIATYNLARQMSIAPQSLYQSYLSPSTYWMLLNRAANTYGNSQPVDEFSQHRDERALCLPVRQRSSNWDGSPIRHSQHCRSAADRRTGRDQRPERFDH